MLIALLGVKVRLRKLWWKSMWTTPRKVSQTYFDLLGIVFSTPFVDNGWIRKRVFITCLDVDMHPASTCSSPLNTPRKPLENSVSTNYKLNSYMYITVKIILIWLKYIISGISLVSHRRLDSELCSHQRIDTGLLYREADGGELVMASKAGKRSKTHSNRFLCHPQSRPKARQRDTWSRSGISSNSLPGRAERPT